VSQLWAELEGEKFEVNENEGWGGFGIIGV
jgi:hypothetical protein